MNCNEVYYYMSKFYYDTLDELLKCELATHLGLCPSCRKKAEEMIIAIACFKKYINQDTRVKCSDLKLKIYKSNKC